MKHKRYAIVVFFVITYALSACRQGGNVPKMPELPRIPSVNEEEPSPRAPFTITDEIMPVTRERESGTRRAFIDLFSIGEMTGQNGRGGVAVRGAVTVQSAAAMSAAVSENQNAIGYISFSAFGPMVKALKINGTEIDLESISNGRYDIARPLVAATQIGMSREVEDFLSFLSSKEGQEVIAGRGYAPLVKNPDEFKSNKAKGRIVVTGAPSLALLIDDLREAYEAENDDVEIRVRQENSTEGMRVTAKGLCDMGMAARELDERELTAGLIPTVIARDGIAVIVNHANPIDNLETEDVMNIFRGEKKTWEELMDYYVGA